MFNQADVSYRDLIHFLVKRENPSCCKVLSTFFPMTTNLPSILLHQYVSANQLHCCWEWSLKYLDHPEPQVQLLMAAMLVSKWNNINKTSINFHAYIQKTKEIFNGTYLWKQIGEASEGRLGWHDPVLWMKKESQHSQIAIHAFNTHNFCVPCTCVNAYACSTDSKTRLRSWWYQPEDFILCELILHSKHCFRCW